MKTLYLFLFLFSTSTTVYALDHCGVETIVKKKGKLIFHVNESENVDLWSNEEANKLSFCVSEKFNSDYDHILKFSIEVAKEWMKYANVDFQIEGDLSCENTEREVLFKIVPVTRRSRYIARAFFPGSERRKIQINRRYTDLSDDLMRQLLLHEFGHVLGFRHEHINTDNPEECRELEDHVTVTAYDPLSIMHYKNCTTGGLRNFILSDLDKLGASKAYPFSEE